MLIGIISDTHGLLRPQAEQALAGVQAILHAGDVGQREVLLRLRQIAPVYAVRGNVDVEAWAAAELPLTNVVELGGITFYMLHNLRELDVLPEAAHFDFVISGHTHKAEQFERQGVLYVNPGSAGPKRFHLPVTLGLLDLAAEPRSVRIVDLKV